MREPEISREEAENWLYEEADLLDEWRLDRWLELFEPDGRYEIPPLDVPEGDSRDTLFLIADDLTQLRSRVEHLMHGLVLAENPRSRTRRLITNVRARELEGSIEVRSSFAVHRFRRQDQRVFVGRYVHTLVRRAEGLKIRTRRAILDHETLQHHGTISIIL